MANYATLKAAIENVVKTNGNNEITGALLQQSLISMINALGAGYQFMGVANPSTNPGTPDQRVFYLASQRGIYTNFGSLNVTGLSVLYYDTIWRVSLLADSGNSKIISFDSFLRKDLGVVGEITQVSPERTMTGYYTTAGTFVANNDVITKIYALEKWNNYIIRASVFGVGTIANVVFLDDNDNVIGAFRQSFADNVFVPIGFSKIGVSGSTGGNYYVGTADVGAKDVVDGIITTQKIAPASVTLEKLNDALKLYKTTASPNYSDQIAECYIVALPAGNVILQSYSNRAYLYTLDSGVTAMVDQPSENNVVYPIAVNSSSNPDYPNGKIVGYVVFKDVTGFLNNPNPGRGPQINREYAENLTNSPRIADYLLPYSDELKNKVDIKVGKNLFNPNAVILNRFINRTNGTTGVSDTCGVTDFIPVNNNNLYFNHGFYGGAVIGHAVYSQNKAFLRGFTTKAYTFQTGDYYVRFSFLMADLAGSQIEIGTSETSYEPFNPIGGYPLSVDIEDITFKIYEAGKNKLNPATVQENKYINYTNGAVNSASGLYATDFIPVSTQGLYFNRLYFGGVAIGGAVYDKNKQYLRAQNTAAYLYQDGDGFVRYSFLSQYLADAQVEVGAIPTTYEPYSAKPVIDPNYLPSDWGGGGGGDTPEEETINIYLPKYLYAVVGDTLQVFFKGLIQAVDPLNYNVIVQCSKGKQYRRYFEYTPTSADVGTTAFTIYIKDNNGKTLGAATCSLITTNVVQSPATAKNVLCIGDSLTASGTWPNELNRRLTGSGGTPVGKELTNINFVGSMQLGNTNYLGKSGWSWVDFCTSGRPAFRFTVTGTPAINVGNVYSNNGHSYTVIEVSDNNTILCSTSSLSNTPLASGQLVLSSGSGDATVNYSAYSADSQNPFWDYQNNKLTFIPYANTYCNGKIDLVYILLGGNGITPWQSDFSTFYGYMETFVETLHTEFPNCKVVLMSCPYPSMVNMMPTYGASGSGYADTFGILVTLHRMRKAYQDFAERSAYSSFVSYVDLPPQFDGDYNFPLTQKDVNTRNSAVKEPYDNNALHAAAIGYYQYADAVFREFVKNNCQ